MRYRNILLLLVLTVSVQECHYYDNANEHCKIKEYYNYDGVEYNKCYE